VAEHNTSEDCWVTIFHQVFDLSKLVAENFDSSLVDPIVLAAGTDISHWFDRETREPKKFVNPETGLLDFFCPQGRYLHVPPTSSVSDYRGECVPFDISWWHDNDRFCIGRLTKQVRKVSIMNTLTKDEETIEVACEETLNEILERYLKYNSHAFSYTWKRMGQVLNMNLSLAENGVVDESEDCLYLGMDPQEYVPMLHLYFDDDLTLI